MNDFCFHVISVIEKKGGKAKLVEFDGFLDMFGVPQLNQSIDDKLAAIIGEKMQENFPATLREKMKDKNGEQLSLDLPCSDGDVIEVSSVVCLTVQ